MLIGIISDTHVPDRANTLPKKVVDEFSNVDLIIHCGDVTDKEILDLLNDLANVVAVRGNMDYLNLPRKEILEIKERFIHRYNEAVTELNYKNLYELVIAVVLSAQCTDKRVNIITPALFKKYPDINTLACANLDDVKEIIKSCSFFNNKAKNIVEMAKIVRDKFNSIIPHSHKELIKLPGVGNKTENVFLIELNGENRMAVDTHVFRVVHRL